MQPLTLRLAEEADLPACEALDGDSLIHTCYFSEPGAFGRRLRNAQGKGQLYAAFTADGTAAGVMCVVPRGFCGMYPYLSLLNTGSAFRGQGVGAFLLEALERMGREDCARKVSLLVSGFNTDAQRFYRSHGYYEAGRIPSAAKEGIDEILMLKDLT